MHTVATGLYYGNYLFLEFITEHSGAHNYETNPSVSVLIGNGLIKEKETNILCLQGCLISNTSIILL